MINVTKPFLAPLEEYTKIFKEIWQRNWLTNNGPVLNELEQKLASYLELDNLLYLSNGTIALQIAIKALDLEQGEILTTPFSFIATTSAIFWEGYKPIFVDIEKDSLNIDPLKIEAAITKKTKAILATHVYGNPCKIDEIALIAKKHNLKVIYDAAHCFGTKYKGKSVFSYGDISTMSFHATKLFHTVEGGAVSTPHAELNHTMSRLRNFGHETPYSFSHAGINGKNSELHAAMGLVNLKYIEDVLESRKRQYLRYIEKLEGHSITFIKINKHAEFNYAYCPIMFKTEKDLLSVEEELNKNYIYPRRYFRPSLNKLNYTNNCSCPVSEDICDRVLTVPLYHDLNNNTIDMICKIILKSVKSNI